MMPVRLAARLRPVGAVFAERGFVALVEIGARDLGAGGCPIRDCRREAGLHVVIGAALEGQDRAPLPIIASLRLAALGS